MSRNWRAASFLGGVVGILLLDQRGQRRGAGGSLCSRMNSPERSRPAGHILGPQVGVLRWPDPRSPFPTGLAGPLASKLVGRASLYLRSVPQNILVNSGRTAQSWGLLVYL